MAPLLSNITAYIERITFYIYQNKLTNYPPTEGELGLHEPQGAWREDAEEDDIVRHGAASEDWLGGQGEPPV